MPQALAEAAWKTCRMSPPTSARVCIAKSWRATPAPEELELAMSYLTGGTLEQYAQALLSTNEEIFWP